jgi:hypothetical protein
MSRKDYIVIAKSIKANLTDKVDEKRLDDFLYDLCSVMRQDNHMFDQHKFIEACKGNLITK